MRSKHISFFGFLAALASFSAAVLGLPKAIQVSSAQHVVFHGDESAFLLWARWLPPQTQRVNRACRALSHAELVLSPCRLRTAFQRVPKPSDRCDVTMLTQWDSKVKALTRRQPLLFQPAICRSLHITTLPVLLASISCASWTVLLMDTPSFPMPVENSFAYGLASPSYPHRCSLPASSREHVIKDSASQRPRPALEPGRLTRKQRSSPTFLHLPRAWPLCFCASLSFWTA